MDPHLLSPIAVDSVRRTHFGDEKRMREPAVSFTAERGTRMLGNANRRGKSRTSCWLVITQAHSFATQALLSPMINIAHMICIL
jgi:hypothetical protein